MMKAKEELPTGYQLPDFCLVRMAALPCDDVYRMSETSSDRLAEQIIELEKRSFALVGDVSQDLYDLVTTLKDRRRLRRIALRLRRDVFNCRAPTCDRSDIDALLEFLPKYAQTRVAETVAILTEIDRLRRSGDVASTKDLDTLILPALSRFLNEPVLGRTIALTRPALFKRLSDKKHCGRLDRKAAITLLKFVHRASLKTSPLGLFMLRGFVSTAGGGDDISWDTFDVRTKYRLERGIATRIMSSLSTSLLSSSSVTLQPNATVERSSDGNAKALVSAPVFVLNRFWSQQRYSQFRLHDDVIDLLCSLPDEFTVSWLERRLLNLGLSESVTTQMMAKMLERDLLRVSPTIDAYSEDPLDCVKELLSSIDSPPTRNAIKTINKMIDSVPTSCADSLCISASQSSILALERELMTSFGNQSCLPDHNPVSGDSYFCGNGATLGSRHLDLIGEVAVFLRSQIAIRPEYCTMRSLFIERFGHDGVCQDTFAFFLEAGHLMLRGDWAKSDVNKPDKHADVDMLSGCTSPVTAFIQFAIDREGDRNADRAVVNRVFEGTGWLMARHLDASPAPEDHTRKLRRWLKYCAAPAEPVDIPISGHCNDLQAHREVTNRTLVWPGEPICLPAANQLLLRDTRLRMNPDSQLLELIDQYDQPVAPAYLGSSQPLPSWGSQYAALLIGTPTYIQRPSVSRADWNNPIVSIPRRMFKRIILTRSSWSVDSKHVLESCSAKTDFERLMSLIRIFDDYGIPKQLFVQSHHDSRSISPVITGNDRKPMYIDIRNPLCIDILLKLAGRTQALLFSEVFPTQEFATRVADGRRHVAEFQFEMAVTPSHT